MRQNDFIKYKNIYDYGCYFLSLLYCGLNREPTFNEIDKYYDIFLSEGIIDSECFVNNPEYILRYLTNNIYKIDKTKYIDYQADFIIALYKTKYHSHFVVLDDKANLLWDPIKDSNTYKNGVVDSYRLFYRK